MTPHRENPEMLARLKAWAEPIIGEVSDRSLRDLQDILETASEECGIAPQYRKMDS